MTITFKQLRKSSKKDLLRKYDAKDMGIHPTEILQELNRRSMRNLTIWIAVFTTIITLATILQLAKAYQWFGL